MLWLFMLVTMKDCLLGYNLRSLQGRRIYFCMEMEAVGSSDTVVTIYQNIRLRIPEDINLTCFWTLSIIQSPKHCV
jgi:hypothetical protein